MTWNSPLQVPPLPGFEHLTISDQPHVGAEEILDQVRWTILEHPRSQQRRIGPSEIGHPCPRFLIHKIAQHEEPRFTLPWRATVGTALHTWLEDAMKAAPQYPGRPRYLTERKVIVGSIGGQIITGSCDLFDVETGCVWDWKTTNKTHMTEYRRHGVGQKYRAQRHLYGRGWELLGHKVVAVGNIFLMREGELRDTFVDYEAYDRQIALDALERCNQLAALIAGFGVDTALAMYPTLCDDEWCGYCRTDRNLLPRSTNTTELISA